jgi:hypothetical protein
MKKTFVIAFVLAAMVGLLAAGVAFAQDDNPPFGDRGPKDGSGLLHDYMSEAMADALGMTVEELQASHDAGGNFSDLALAQDLTEEELSALMQDARTTALDAAAKDGVITQEQADLMKERGAGRGGSGNGVCDGSGAFDRSGARGGRQGGRGTGAGTSLGATN